MSASETYTPSHHNEPRHEAGNHGLSHVMPPKILIGVWLALVALTGITVLTATNPIFNFGAYPNLVIAMIIATVKASLVCLFFMHLLYDRKFNLMIFMGSLFFVCLFVSFTMMDSGQYQNAITSRVESQLQQ